MLTISLEKPAVKKTVDRQALANELEELEASRKAELPVLQQAVTDTAVKVRAAREPYAEAKRLHNIACADKARFDLDGARVERIQNRIRHSADPAISDVVANIDARLDNLRQTGIKITSVERGKTEVVNSNADAVHDEMSQLQQARQRCEALKLQVGIDVESELGKILHDLEGRK